jgi:predicted nucleotidyltransferase
MGTHRKHPAQAHAPVSVADALFSRVQQRVLGVLFGNPARTFYTNEIIAATRSGTGAVQRELARLESAHLALTSRIGNQKHYQANAHAPVFAELRGLVLKTSGLADAIRSAIAPLSAAISAAFVFGSVAKREDKATSDIDLMIISDTIGYPDIFNAIEPLSATLSRKLNPTVYSRKEWAKRVHEKNSFVLRVRAQPKIWILGGERDVAT